MIGLSECPEDRSVQSMVQGSWWSKEVDGTFSGSHIFRASHTIKTFNEITKDFDENLILQLFS
jgi:hypothetical protein